MKSNSVELNVVIMTVKFLKLYLIVIFGFVTAKCFVFVDEGRRHHGSASQDFSTAPTKRPSFNIKPMTIDNIFKIPTTFIQTASAAAQSISPNNANAINQFSDIPVQTLQAIGNLVKDVIPQQVDNQASTNEQDERLQRLKRIREHQQQLQMVNDVQQQNEDHTTHRRHILGGLGWVSSFKDLLFGGYGHKSGGNYGNLFENNIYFIDGQENHQGHKKIRKNKRGHFGGHKGNRRFFDDDSNYDVHRVIDNILPSNFFSWRRSRSDRIQNKIAPGFDDSS